VPGSAGGQWSEMASAPHWLVLRAAAAPWLALQQFLFPSRLTIRRRAHADALQLSNPLYLLALIASAVVIVGGFCVLVHRLAYCTSSSNTLRDLQRLQHSRYRAAEAALLLALIQNAHFNVAFGIDHTEPV
jgi:hypothetical protein